jgi:pimeloyl-ACP methyl ester carboxylesterase
MYSYRAFRHLALRLAELGFPVLRFDYYGTGNSSGDPHGPGQVAAWRASIRIAAEELRERSQCDTIAMAGLRLGATLAEVAATEIPVDTLILWDPCVTGASYVREIKMLSMTSGELSGGPVINQDTGDIEALGFALTPEMVRDISSIDLLKIDTRPTLRALLLHRVGSSIHDRLASHLRTVGTEVTEHPYKDHETFMVAAIRSQLPKASLHIIQEWLVSAYPTTAPATALEASSTQAQQLSSFPTRLHIDTAIPIHEDAVMLNDKLFGVVTEPDAAQSDQQTKPAIIFLNTGADHHIGPRRMYVQLARVLAQQGFSILRFDLAGLGDSSSGPNQEDNVSYPENANDDIRAAIDYLRMTRMINQVVLAGMCSGGYHAVHLASTHPEAVGMISINPALYWKKGDPTDIEYFEQLLQPQSLTRAAVSSDYWLRLLRRELSIVHALRAIIRKGGAILRSKARILGQRDSPVDQFVPLLPPRIDTHLIFAENDFGLLYLQNDLKKLLAVLQARPNFKLTIIQGAGHVFIPLQGQAKLNDTIMTWLLGRYGAQPSPSPKYHTGARHALSNGTLNGNL